MYYKSPIPSLRFSRYLELSDKNRLEILSQQVNLLIDIVAFCIMPTHFHLLLKQNTDNGITQYLFNLQNSYSHYFNIRNKRRGPLWESKFRNIRVKSDEQLLHLTRYIHLNPSSAGLANNPEDWQWSSLNEYVNGKENICQYKDIINISPQEYGSFVLDRKDYQKELSKIKALLIEHYTG